jgi:hypothetical protein
MGKRLLPEGFEDYEPLQVEVMEDGYAVGVPFRTEDVDGVTYRKKSCMTVKQTCSYLEAVVAEIEAARNKE